MHSLVLCGSVTGTAMISLSQTVTEDMTRYNFLPTSSSQQLFKLSYFINGFPYRTKGKKFLSNCTLSGCSSRKMDHFLKIKRTTCRTVSLQLPLRSPLQEYRPIIYHSQTALEEPTASYRQKQPQCFPIFLLLAGIFAALVNVKGNNNPNTQSSG